MNAMMSNDEYLPVYILMFMYQLNRIKYSQ